MAHVGEEYCLGLVCLLCSSQRFAERLALLLKFLLQGNALFEFFLLTADLGLRSFRFQLEFGVASGL